LLGYFAGDARTSGVNGFVKSLLETLRRIVIRDSRTDQFVKMNECVGDIRAPEWSYRIAERNYFFSNRVSLSVPP
jgi:hypothetical protein